MFALYDSVLSCLCLTSKKLLSAYPMQSEMVLVDLQLHGWQSLGSLLVHRIVRVVYLCLVLLITHNWPRKPRAAPAVALTTCRRHTSELRLGQPRPLMVPSTAGPEIDDAQPQADVGCSSTFINNEQYRVSRTSRSPSAAAEALPVAKYQEWLFQGFLKRTRIGDDVTYNLEFKLAIDFGTLSLND